MYNLGLSPSDLSDSTHSLSPYCALKSIHLNRSDPAAAGAPKQRTSRMDSREQLRSLLLKHNKSHFTLVPHFLTAFSSLRLPVAFLFEADLIPHNSYIYLS